MNLTSAEMRQLDAEADAYQSLADAERERAPFRRIEELEQTLRMVLAQWDTANPQTPEDQRVYRHAQSVLENTPA